MDFSLSSEQQMIQDSVSRFILNDYDFDTRRKILGSTAGFSQENWNVFAELGWLMLPFAEEDGGLSGSMVDLALVMEEFGKGMVVEPFVATAVMAGGLIATTGNQQQKDNYLPRIMAGELQMAFAYAEPQSRYHLNNVTCSATKVDGEFVITGQKSVVLNGNHAETLIVAARTSGDTNDKDGISLFLVDANHPSVKRQGYANVDGHQAADIWFEKTPNIGLLGELNRALPVIDHIIDKATLAICAEAVGAMQIAHERTLEYAKTRKQFGRTIGSFQALQHRMVNMFMEHQQAKSILLMAALKMDINHGSDAKALSAAKSRIGKAANLVGREAIQIHGGIGMTDEIDVGHIFKRLTTIQFLFGSTDVHTRRFASLK
ncbi:acyl-CoA dehydrogenase [uncultured Paraglaciecola sp.]|jgi:alkylation response protein AidB-like acyl-CoA dehydrogenase|uniref:acyl-CoA dehydrogenase family protein n=1 Tax=uncultured Paraglaciecola sp. TaxID=1765024 RepID=UPI0025E7C1A5|nr:acyl-CoA dehydrogenase [uncultured Paraglaciecola sp.]